MATALLIGLFAGLLAHRWPALHGPAAVLTTVVAMGYVIARVRAVNLRPLTRRDRAERNLDTAGRTAIALAAGGAAGWVLMALCR
jgi:hypothetical protein